MTLGGAEVTGHEPLQLHAAGMAEMWNVRVIELKPQDSSGLHHTYGSTNTVTVGAKAGREGCEMSLKTARERGKKRKRKQPQELLVMGRLA